MTLAPQLASMAPPAYKISKAALNMLTVQYAVSYPDQGFTFVALSPGVSLCRPLVPSTSYVPSPFPSLALFLSPTARPLSLSLAISQPSSTDNIVTRQWLQTEMGGANAHLSVERGAKAVLEAVHERGKEANGHFVDIRIDGWEDTMGMNLYSGADLPW